MQICERSLTSSTGGPTGPPSTCFARAEMLPSGCLIRPCEGGGSIVHIVDHIDLDVSYSTACHFHFFHLLTSSFPATYLLCAIGLECS